MTYPKPSPHGSIRESIKKAHFGAYRIGAHGTLTAHLTKRTRPFWPTDSRLVVLAKDDIVVSVGDEPGQPNACGFTQRLGRGPGCRFPRWLVAKAAVLPPCGPLRE